MNKIKDFLKTIGAVIDITICKRGYYRYINSTKEKFDVNGNYCIEMGKGFINPKYCTFVFIDYVTPDDGFSCGSVFKGSGMRGMKLISADIFGNNGRCLYVRVKIRIRYNDIDKFKHAMDRLRSKIIILGATEYQDYCNKVITRYVETTNSLIDGVIAINNRKRGLHV